MGRNGRRGGTGEGLVKVYDLRAACLVMAVVLVVAAAAVALVCLIWVAPTKRSMLAAKW